jgi:uncharacterized protein YdeI (YjbR/CyaY-like superfamily)
MDSEDAVCFGSRQEWRDWLSRYHDKEDHIWLLHYKKQSGKISVDLADAVEEAICFGWIDGKLKSIDKESYTVRYSQRRSGSAWSKINKDRAERLIASGQMTPAGMAKIEEARKNRRWDTAYTNRHRDVLPTDLESALRQDNIAWSNFKGFANSYCNMYIGWVDDAKTEKTRQRRINEVVKRSRENIKPGIQ